jgi:peptidoglycan/xylan/chitin deacetylase (PgdA/CDA1 family)
MIGLIPLKHFVRRTAGLCALAENKIRGQRVKRRGCILYYHRVADVAFTDPRLDDRNVSPRLLDAHLAALSKFAEIVPLTELPERLAHDDTLHKPLVSLSFDDGYANFRYSVLPLLRHYAAPATLSVVTSVVGSDSPAPFDRWAQNNVTRLAPNAWRMATWEELEECVASGLVTIGAHSHRHLKGSDCTAEQLAEEAGTAAEEIGRRFGDNHVSVYAYPFGNSTLGHVSEDYINAVRLAGFKLAVTTDVGLVSAGDDAFSLPRLEAHSQDTPATLLAKCSGAIAPLYLNHWFHKALARRNQGRRRQSPNVETQPVTAGAHSKVS